MKALKTVGIVVGVVALAATGLGAVAGASLAAGGAGTALGIGAATWGTIATAAAIAAGAISIGTALFAPKPSFSSSGNPLQFQTNPQSGLPYAIGRTRMSGLRIHADTYDASAYKSEGKQDVLSFAVLLSAGGAIEGIEKFRADKEEISFNAATGMAAGTYADWMAQKVSLGLAGASALALAFGGGSFPGWSADHKLSGITHALWDLRFDEKGEKFGAGVPLPEWIGKWVKVYDPRKDSTYPGGSGSHRANDESTYEWSRNPALHALTWCLGRWQNGKRTLGIGAPPENIRVADFVEAANVADANGWTCGGVEWSTDPKWTILKRMLQACGAEPTMTGAMIGCRVNTPRISIATVPAAKVLDGLSFATTRSRRDRFNTVIPRYRSEDHDWEIISGSPVSVAQYVAEDGAPRTKEIDFPLVQAETDPAVNGEKQAGELAAYEIVNSREAGPIRFTVGPEYIGVKTGDVITLDVPEEGLPAQPVLIRSRSVDPGTLKITFEAETETDAKHDFALGRTTVPPPTWAPTPPDLVPPVPDAALWSLTAGLSEGLPILTIAGVCEFPGADTVLMEYRKVGDASWTTLGKAEASAPVNAVISSIEGETDYEARVAYQSGIRVGGWLVLASVTTAHSEVEVTLPSDGEGNIVDENGDPYKGGDLRNDALELFPDGNLVFYPTPPLPGIPPIPGVDMIQIGRVTPQGLEAATQASMAQAQNHIDLLGNAVLNALVLQDETRQLVTGAGIYVDEATGQIKLAAYEYAQDRLNDVSIRLDAHDATINLKASYAYVDSAIAQAVLDPSQIPAFSNIEIRLSTVEINLDAMAGAIDLLATTVEVNALGARVTTAEQTIDSLNAQINLKVETTQFDLLQTRVSNAEITLSAIGDVASIEESVRIARLVPRDVEALAQQTLAGLLKDEQNRQQAVELVAEASNQLTASIVDNNAVQAQRTQELAARVYNTETGLTAAQGSIVTVQTALVSATQALADDISTLTVTVGQNKAEATSQLTTLVNQTSAMAADLLQLEAEVDGNLALLQTQYYTKANTDSAIAASKTVLEASITSSANTINARITNEVQALVNADGALTSTVNSMQSTFNANIVGLNAALVTEQQTRANADSALSASVTSLTATVNGNHSTLSAALTTEQQARANGDSALAGSLSTLQTTVGGHTTTISQHTSSINGIRARWGVDIDVNGRVVGAVRLDGSASESTFDVVADKFRVYNGSLDAPVFQISGGNVYLRGNLIQTGSITTGKIAAGSITVPYTMDGPASTYCPVGSQVIVLEMPTYLDVGDAADGGCVIMFFGEIDSAANKDMGLLLRMFVAVNNGPYVLVGTNKGGMRTEGGNTFFDMPVALMHSVTSAYNVRVQVTAQPYLLDNASDTRPGYMRGTKLAIFGGMR